MKRVCILLCWLLVCVVPAMSKAADVSQLMGKWAQKFANGNTFVTEFTATSMAFYGLDSLGKPDDNVQHQTIEVSYQDLGDTIGINFKSGGSIMAMIEHPDTAVLLFPGMPSRKLTRFQPAP